MEIFERLESEVRSFCRAFPTVFTKAIGAELFAESGRAYIDFFAGAAVLNYGHNNPRLKRYLLDYLEADGITHSIDLFTDSKREFLQTFERLILQPRGLHYKLMCTGPTGTNAVEAALKLARKVTGRQTVLAFENSYHGVTLGSLAVTANAYCRQAAGVPLSHAVLVPYEANGQPQPPNLEPLNNMLAQLDQQQAYPAAVILETVQAEGGINVASIPWLQAVAQWAKQHDILLIVDDIQVGCGRTGPFFSFERAGLEPDIVCLSKSISGYGIPMAVLLLKPDVDRWQPGEHGGTFRGHNLAFVTATAALLEFWQTDALQKDVAAKTQLVEERLQAIVAQHLQGMGATRGLGLIQGLVCHPEGLAAQVCATAFQKGLILNSVGHQRQVIRLLPPLTIPTDLLIQGLNILEASVAECVATTSPTLALATR